MFQAIVNMLQNLKISCDYKENGCDEVVKLENLTKHTTSCQFNVTKCDQCYYVKKPGHNCVLAKLELSQ